MLEVPTVVLSSRLLHGHIAAAEAWVNCSAATVEKVFSAGLGGLPGKLLGAIRKAGPDGLTLTEQSNHFSRNRTAAQLEEARAELETRNLIHTTPEPSQGGRDRHRSIAIWPADGIHERTKEANRGTT